MKNTIKKHDLRLYKRNYTSRQYGGKWGKAYYANTYDYVLTNDITPFNKGKKCKFYLVKENPTFKEIKQWIKEYGINNVYTTYDEISDKELYWRPSIRKKLHW